MENNVGQGSPLCIVAWLGHAVASVAERSSCKPSLT
jgi:hypothetical protein